MANTERDRVGFFRQRWAHENFQSQQRISNNDQQAIRETRLSELNAQDPVSPASRSSKPEKGSWRDTFSLSPNNRLALLGTRTPLSDTSTSLRSPVDSHNNTIYSDQQESIASRIEPTSDIEYEDAQTSGGGPQSPPWLNEIYVLAWLTFFSLLGTLARLGVETITQYPDTPVTSRVLWANVGGSLFMGFLVEDRNLFGLPTHLASPSKDDEPPDEPAFSAIHIRHKKTIPLYVGLTTGFCGSFTSFSTFIRDVFLALTNDLPSPSATSPYHNPVTGPNPRNGGFSFLAVSAVLILHPAVSLAAAKAGTHLALGLRHMFPNSRSVFPAETILRFLNPVFVFVGFGCWLVGALFLTIFPPSSGPSPVNWRARATVSLLLAPVGCIMRYYLAKHLNRPSIPNFPWGTFVANVLGSLVLGMAWDLQHARGIGAVAGVGSGNACALLLGTQEGFCGCLTTVSTWVVELNGLRKKWAWIYGLVSIAVAFGGIVVIMGSMAWTIGFSTPVCG